MTTIIQEYWKPDEDYHQSTVTNIAEAYGLLFWRVPASKIVVHR
jgi:hypothetical protein